MDKKNLIGLLFVGIACFSSSIAQAQKSDPDADVNLWVQQPIKVDGNSSEWHEPLNNYNTATKLAFALANDGQNLYLIIESLDEVTTNRLLGGGLTLNINTLGKKRDGVKINFLGMDRDHGSGVDVIQVSGFKDIPDGNLSIPNPKGIQVAAAFNSRRDYICELAIPLAQLGLKGDELKAIAYNIKINKGIERHEGSSHKEGGMPSAERGISGGGKGGGMSHGGGGRHGGGMGGRGGSGSENPAGQMGASDFWIKFELAKPNGAPKSN